MLALYIVFGIGLFAFLTYLAASSTFGKSITEIDNGRNKVDKFDPSYKDIIKIKFDDNLRYLYTTVISNYNREFVERIHDHNNKTTLIYDRVAIFVVNNDIHFNYIVDNFTLELIGIIKYEYIRYANVGDIIHMRCNDSVDIVGQMKCDPVKHKSILVDLNTSSLGYAIMGIRVLECRIGYLDGKLYINRYDKNFKVVDMNMVVES